MGAFERYFLYISELDTAWLKHTRRAALMRLELYKTSKFAFTWHAQFAALTLEYSAIAYNRKIKNVRLYSKKQKMSNKIKSEKSGNACAKFTQYDQSQKATKKGKREGKRGKNYQPVELKKKDFERNPPAKSDANVNITAPSKNETIPSDKKSKQIQQRRRKQNTANIKETVEAIPLKFHLPFTKISNDSSVIQSKYFNGDLQTHEGPGKHDGHTISKHIHTLDYLLEKALDLDEDEQLSASPDICTGEKIIHEVFVNFNDDIKNVLSNKNYRLNRNVTFEVADMGRVTGHAVRQGSTEARECRGARIVARKMKDNPKLTPYLKILSYYPF